MLLPIHGDALDSMRLPAVSADNTKAVVSRMSNGSYQVLELATGNLLRTVPGVPCGRDPSLTWHRQDPDLLIYLCGNQIRTFRVSTGVVTALMTFAEYKRVETREKGTVSDDWSTVALFATKPDGSQEAVHVHGLLCRAPRGGLLGRHQGIVRVRLGRLLHPVRHLHHRLIVGAMTPTGR